MCSGEGRSPVSFDEEAEGTGLRPPPEHSLAHILNRLAPTGRLGVAVSGGSDSLALLLLCARARPGRVLAATVDHGLRAGIAREAAAVAAICARLDVPHETLVVTVEDGASLQARARAARYAALAAWAARHKLGAVATAHHADDQAETLMMRLARGSGIGGLAGVREVRALAGGLLLVRPLLGQRKAALEALVREAGIAALDDPANRDPRHDRTQFRALLAREKALDPVRLARSAAALGEAEEALGWSVERLIAERVRREGATVVIDPAGLPAEYRRRLLRHALGGAVDGPSVERALARLEQGDRCTLGAWQLQGGASWRLEPAPPRRTTRSQTDQS